MEHLARIGACLPQHTLLTKDTLSEEMHSSFLLPRTLRYVIIDYAHLYLRIRDKESSSRILDGLQIVNDACNNTRVFKI